MALPLYKSEPPKYKGCEATPSKNAGGLTGAVCNLFGGITPEYKCSGASPTSGSRCWFQLFPPAPTYQEAPPPIIDPGAGDGSDCACECVPSEDGACEEIHVYPPEE